MTYLFSLHWWSCQPPKLLLLHCWSSQSTGCLFTFHCGSCQLLRLPIIIPLIMPASQVACLSIYCWSYRPLSWPFSLLFSFLFTKHFCNAFKMFFRNYLANCFQYLDSSPQQCTLPSGPECQRCWPSCGFASFLPDLAPCAFFLFPRLKITLKREVLTEITEIQLNTTWQLQAILKQVYHRHNEQWKDLL